MIAPASLSALQLRCLIANDRERIAHFVEQIRDEEVGPFMPERQAVRVRLADTIRLIQDRRAALHALTTLPPAATILAGRTYSVLSQSAASPSTHV